MPPTPVRRLFTVPAVTALAVVVAVSVPVVVVLNSPVLLWRRPRWRMARIAGFLLLYLCVDLTVATRVFGWWLRCGRGARRAERRQAAAYQALTWALGVLYRAATRIVGLRVRVVAPDGSLGAAPIGAGPCPHDPLDPQSAAAPTGSGEGGEADGGPLLVFSRHAGPGDSFLLVYALLSRLRRSPRVVLKDTLKLDPGVDAALSGVPSLFIDVNPEDGERVSAAIRELSAGLGPDEALVLFPEGGNFTEHRRRRVIAHLRKRGERGRAAQARRLRHVLPPRPDGALAALAGAPHADVVLVAHTGLDDLNTIGRIWRGLPLEGRVLLATWWKTPVAALPAGVAERRAWLFERWAAIDDWVGRHRHDAGAEAGERRAS